MKAFASHPLRVVVLCVLSLIVATVAWAEEETFSPPRAYETKQAINMRSGPGSGNEVLRTLKSGERVRVTALVNGWYRIELESGSGYVYKSFLTPAKGEAPAPTAAPAAEQTKPTEATKPEEPAKPEESAKPEEPAKPAEQPKPATPAKPAEPTKPAEATKPAEQAKALAASKYNAATCPRIKFPQDTMSGAAQSSVAQGKQDCYLLGVEQDQWMEFWLSSDESNGAFKVYTPEGQTMTENNTHWLGRAKTAGDYAVVVSPSKGNCVYTLKMQLR